MGKVFDGIDASLREWIAAQPGLTATKATCRETTEVETVDLEEVAPGIWVRRGIIAQIEAENRGRIANLSVVIGSDSVAVIDAGASRAEGQALYAAIRRLKSQGGAVIIMAHRPAAIAECELLLVMSQGTRQAFGPRDEVLRSTVRNAETINRAKGAGGGVT